MLKRGTLVLLLSAIALGGAVLLLENRSGSRSRETVSGESEVANEKLFPFEEDEVEQFSVVRSQRAVDTEPAVPDADNADPEEDSAAADSDESEAKAEEAEAEEAKAEEAKAEEAKAEEEKAEEKLSFVKSDDGTWQMTAPEEARAEGGAIAFLLSQVTTPAALPVFVEADNLEEFGLSEPGATVSLTANGREYLLCVGGVDFLGDKRYVQVIEMPAGSADESAEQPDVDMDETVKIYAISGGIINAVNRPTADWLVISDTAAEDSPEQADDKEEDTLP